MTDTKTGKRRRGHGEGTIFERSADGYFCAQVDLGVDEQTGKRRRVVKCFKARREAAAWLMRTLEEKRVGALVKPSKDSLAEYVAQWLETDLLRLKPGV